MIAKVFTLTSVLCCLCAAVLAQEVFKPRPSPLALTTMRYKDAYVKIIYSQPQKRNREVFGTLVPFGQVWRTGANEATEITLTKDLLINNVLVKAGTYSLFTIPEKDKWTIIINSDIGLWGSYNYNPAMDVLRFDVPVQPLNTVYEPFTMIFEQKNEMAELLMMWDKTKVAIPIKFVN
ncbi:MAG: DUF2911 domain-containing protein [Bacteroidota bacterium]